MSFSAPPIWGFVSLCSRVSALFLQSVGRTLLFLDPRRTSDTSPISVKHVLLALLLLMLVDSTHLSGHSILTLIIVSLISVYRMLPDGLTKSSNSMQSNEKAVLGRLLIVFALTWSSAAFGFAANDRVQASGVGVAYVNVRATPADALVAGTQTNGNVGTIVGGPVVASLNGTPHTWWQVNWDIGTDGWVASTGLIADGFRLSFPLAGSTHLTAVINSVFDHSQPGGPYTLDDAVVAYTGERGEKRFGTDNALHPGLQNSTGTPFVINGHYAGAGTPTYMNYDGHPGIDYRAASGTPVLATADGILHYPSSIPGNSNAVKFNTVAIDHDNGYITYYLHGSSYPSLGNELISEGSFVRRGQTVAMSGDAGVPGVPHLHVEVHVQSIPVDPYGWTGSGADPYTAASNVNLWESAPVGTSACIQYSSFFEEASSRFKIPSNLLKAIAMAESGDTCYQGALNPNDGGCGVMQLTSTTKTSAANMLSVTEAALCENTDAGARLNILGGAAVLDSKKCWNNPRVFSSTDFNNCKGGASPAFTQSELQKLSSTFETWWWSIVAYNGAGKDGNVTTSNYPFRVWNKIKTLNLTPSYPPLSKTNYLAKFVSMPDKLGCSSTSVPGCFVDFDSWESPSFEDEQLQPTASSLAPGVTNGIRWVKADFNAFTEITAHSNDGSVYSATGSILVNGTCGTANSSTYSSQPTQNLCSTGTTTFVSGTGPWSWSCSGANGGTTASCSAQLTSIQLLPGSPAIVSITSGNGSASVNFTAPTTGSVPTSYTASCSATGQTTQPQSGNSSPIVVSGLVNGVSYSCSVIAKNVNGESTPSPFVNVTPAAIVVGPTITAVVLPSAVASSTAQTMTIYGANFNPATDPNASKLVFTNPSGTALPSRTPETVTPSSLTYTSSWPTAGTWSVKVVNGALETSPYLFSISAAAVQLTGLSISGPSTVVENGTASFSAKALLSDTSQPNVTASWTVSGSAASIDSASGRLTAGNVSSDTVVTVSAIYTLGGITKIASWNVSILHVTVTGTAQTQELVVNGGFENGSNGWVMSGAKVPNTSLYPHSGNGYVVMAEADNNSDTMYQAITIPSNAVSASLSYWYNILSDEPGTNHYDSLNVSVRDTSGSVLAVIDTKWNTDKDPGAGSTYYHQKTFDLLAFRGQTIWIHFRASTDATYWSYFKIDDVSVQVAIPPAATLTGLVINGPSSVAENSNANYTATAIYSDGTTSIVAPNSWGVTTSTALITGSGLLTTGPVSANTQAVVSTSFTAGGVTVNGSVNITIVDIQVVVDKSLTVSKIGGGVGTVTSSDSSISCGVTCSSTYANVPSVTLTAQPAAGSTFGSWAGCDSTNGASCTVAMTYSRSVSVTFSKIVVSTFSLDIGPSGAGVGTITATPGGSCISNTSCPGSYLLPVGTNVTLSALAAPGSVFAGWSGGYGSAYLCNGSGNCDFSLNSASSVSAIFVRQQYALDLTVIGTGGGSVVSSPMGINCSGGTCSANYNSGSSITLTATAAGGSLFTSWAGCPNAVGNSCTVLMDSAQNVTATFSPTVVPTYGLSVGIAGGGQGSVVSSPSGISCSSGTCNANFNVGSSVILTATPSSGSTFTGWSGGACSGSGTCTLSMGAALRVNATFVLASPPPPPTGLSAGGYSSCAINNTGGVLCWGYKQITGTSTDSSVPVAISGLLGPATAVAVGQTHACALTTAGAVQCWGFNGNGELGNGTTTTSTVPTLVSGLSSGVIGITAGNTNACALKSTGAVVCWGGNGSTQLGTGAAGLTKSLTPVTINGLPSGVTKVVASVSYMCALTSVGAVYCWGDNGYGTLGNGSLTGTNSATPVAVTGLVSGVTDITAASAGGRHTCAVDSGGVVKCWGRNLYGELGDGTSGNIKGTPVTVLGLPSRVSAAKAGNDHTCFMTVAGAVWCLGSNVSGQLGNGTLTDSLSPVVVSGITGPAILIAAGGGHSCAQTNTGEVQCWGINAQSQLGDGTTTTRTSPVAVSGLALNATIPGAPVVGVASGGDTQATVNFSDPSTNGGAAVSLFTVVASPGGASATGPTSPITVSGLTNGISYAFTVAATNSIGMGATSAASNAVTPVGNLTQSINFGAAPSTIVAGGSGTVTVTGGASGNAISLISGTPAVCSILGATVTGITAGACTIVANQGGSANYLSAPEVSLPILIGKGSQTIQSGTLPTLAVGKSGVLAATTSASLAVTFTNTTPAICSLSASSVTGTTVTGVASGACSITATQGGDANFNAAPPATLNLLIGKGSQSINFSGTPSVAVGGSATVSATASSGLPVTYQAAPLSVCKLSGSSLIGVSAGNCTVTADQAGDANFLVAQQAVQAITVGKAAQQITFWGAPTLTVGGTDSVLASSSSGLPVSYRNLTPTICSLSAEIVIGIAPGTCTIGANQGGSADYFVASEMLQSFSVAQGNQAISFSPTLTATYGAAPITLSASASSGQTVSFALISGPAILNTATNTLTITGAGNVLIKASQAGNSNYSAAADVTQTIVVSPKALVITASNASRAFGAANPATPGFTAPALVGTDAISVTYTYAATANASASVGTTHAITPSAAVFNTGSAANYTISYVAGTLTIAGTASQAISFAQGWNLLGNSLNQAFSVVPALADPAIVTTVWKWDVIANGWQFYSPSLLPTDLQAYATTKGYQVLSVINPGEGYWVNAKVAGSINGLAGSAFTLGTANLMTGWNLVATGSDVAPAAFNLSLSATPPSVGTIPNNLTSLWAWDSTLLQWYFYAPSLDASGGLGNYITSKSYLDFGQHGKTLGIGTGFWVNKP